MSASNWFVRYSHTLLLYHWLEKVRFLRVISSSFSLRSGTQHFSDEFLELIVAETRTHRYATNTMQIANRVINAAESLLVMRKRKHSEADLVSILWDFSPIVFTVEDPVNDAVLVTTRGTRKKK